MLCSDLGENCSVKTINGANIDLLRSWITEHLSKTPTECILYCGIKDILDELPHVNIYDKLGALVSDLKEKNSNMKAYICQVIPISESQETKKKIETYNEHLLEWGESNGITILKTTQNFRFSTGEYDDMCFDDDNGCSILNRLGVVRLLDTISTQCSEFKLCKNWNKAKKSHMNISSVNTDNGSLSVQQSDQRDSRQHQLPRTAMRLPADPPPPPVSVALSACPPPLLVSAGPSASPLPAVPSMRPLPPPAMTAPGVA